MSLAPVVDARYRLHADDLLGPRRVVIRKVALQGLEASRPVVHFAGLTKTLVLDAQQCNDLARITRSAVLADWVGADIVLDPTTTADGTLVIMVRAPGETLSQTPRRPRLFLLGGRGRGILLVLLIALLVMVGLQQSSFNEIWSFVQVLLSNR